MTAAAEMPEDVIQAAREAAAKVWADVGGEALAAEFRSGMRDDSGSVESAAAAILADRQRDQWQPIETAPKDGTPIDLWGVNHLHPKKTGRRATDVTWGPVRDWMGRERADWQHGMAEDFEPTHWQPLPAAPKGGAE